MTLSLPGASQEDLELLHRIGIESLEQLRGIDPQYLEARLAEASARIGLTKAPPDGETLNSWIEIAETTAHSTSRESSGELGSAPNLAGDIGIGEVPFSPSEIVGDPDLAGDPRIGEESHGDIPGDLHLSGDIGIGEVP